MKACQVRVEYGAPILATPKRRRQAELLFKRELVFAELPEISASEADRFMIASGSDRLSAFGYGGRLYRPVLECGANAERLSAEIQRGTLSAPKLSALIGLDAAFGGTPLFPRESWRNGVEEFDQVRCRAVLADSSSDMTMAVPSFCNSHLMLIDGRLASCTQIPMVWATDPFPKLMNHPRSIGRPCPELHLVHRHPCGVELVNADLWEFLKGSRHQDDDTLLLLNDLVCCLWSSSWEGFWQVRSPFSLLLGDREAFQPWLDSLSALVCKACVGGLALPDLASVVGTLSGFSAACGPHLWQALGFEKSLARLRSASELLRPVALEDEVELALAV